jgi:mannose-1-phosphate guanylyltransferase/mannose-6-phosphate isomerase
MPAASAEAVDKGYRDLDFCRLDEAAFMACPSDSIDYAVMEHTRHAVVVPASSAGATSVPGRRCGKCRMAMRTATCSRGDVYLDNVKNTLVRAESRIVAVIGVDDLVVVETPDAVLVAHKDQVQRVKQVVDHLKGLDRTEHLHHTASTVRGAATKASISATASRSSALP